jgi:hypothetical protein
MASAMMDAPALNRQTNRTSGAASAGEAKLFESALEDLSEDEVI